MLKPKNMSEENSQSWRPMIGMTHLNQHGRLGISGHRALSYVYVYESFTLYKNLYSLCSFF